MNWSDPTERETRLAAALEWERREFDPLEDIARAAGQVAANCRVIAERAGDRMAASLRSDLSAGEQVSDLPDHAAGAGSHGGPAGLTGETLHELGQVLHLDGQLSNVKGLVFRAHRFLRQLVGGASDLTVGAGEPGTRHLGSWR